MQQRPTASFLRNFVHSFSLSLTFLSYVDVSDVYTLSKFVNMSFFLCVLFHSCPGGGSVQHQTESYSKQEDIFLTKFL